MTGATATTPDHDRTRRDLLDLAFGTMAGYALRAVTVLGLPDRIGDGAVRPVELAADGFGTEDTLRRLLRALVPLGLCLEAPDGGVTLTPRGALLRRDHPESVRESVLLFTAPVMLAAWARLDVSVREGRPVFEDLFDAPPFELAGRDPALAALFGDAMSQGTVAVARAVGRGYDFTPFRHVVDVGGNDGTLLTTVLAAAPHLRGTLVDTENGVAGARERASAAGVLDRCTIRAVDFFVDPLPPSDVYLLKSVLHDWDDERAVELLRRCAERLAPGGRVLVVEPVLPSTAAPSDSPEPYLSDLNVLVNLGGRERTRADFDRLCARAGLTVRTERGLPGQMGFSLIEAGAA